MLDLNTPKIYVVPPPEKAKPAGVGGLSGNKPNTTSIAMLYHIVKTSPNKYSFICACLSRHLLDRNCYAASSALLATDWPSLLNAESLSMLTVLLVEVMQ